MRAYSAANVSGISLVRDEVLLGVQSNSNCKLSSEMFEARKYVFLESGTGKVLENWNPEEGPAN